MNETSFLTIDDLWEEFFGCIAKERNTANKELVQYDAHRPPVNHLACKHKVNHPLKIELTPPFSLF